MPLLEDKLACTARRQALPSCWRLLQHREPGVCAVTSAQNAYACEKPLLHSCGICKGVQAAGLALWQARGGQLGSL